MAEAADRLDGIRFVHANWSLHARIAAVSPNPMLRSLYVNLLDQIESHTLAVLPYGANPVPAYLAERHALHSAIIDAISDRDRDRALALIAGHNTSNPPPAASAAARPRRDHRLG
jgi:DNA-binding FadR family transcriptional regulator